MNLDELEKQKKEVIEFAKSEMEAIEHKLGFYKDQWEIVTRNMESGENLELKNYILNQMMTYYIFKGWLEGERSVNEEKKDENKEFNQEAAYRNFVNVLAAIRAELHEMNKHLKVIERRK